MTPDCFELLNSLEKRKSEIIGSFHRNPSWNSSGTIVITQLFSKQYKNNFISGDTAQGAHSCVFHRVYLVTHTEPIFADRKLYPLCTHQQNFVLPHLYCDQSSLSAQVCKLKI